MGHIPRIRIRNLQQGVGFDGHQIMKKILYCVVRRTWTRTEMMEDGWFPDVSETLVLRQMGTANQRIQCGFPSAQGFVILIREWCMVGAAIFGTSDSAKGGAS